MAEFCCQGVVMVQRALFLAAYDIRDPRRLRRALKILKCYASGGQKSVFECYLTPAEKRELMARMEAIMDLAVDRFLIVRLQAGAVRVMGIAVMPVDPAFFYIG
jgi:CRISPR-associated protein Cas2